MSRARILGVVLLAVWASSATAQDFDDPLLSLIESMAGTSTVEAMGLTVAAKLQNGDCDSCPYTNGVCCSEYSTCCPSSRVCVPVEQQPMCGPAPAPKNNNLNVYVGAPAVAPAPAPAAAPVVPGTSDATAELLKQLMASQKRQPSMDDIAKMIRKELRKQLREEHRKQQKDQPTTTTPAPVAPTSEPKPPKVVDTITHYLDIASKHAKVAHHNLNKAADAAVERVNRASRLSTSLSRDGEHMTSLIKHGLGLKYPKEKYQADRSADQETPQPPQPPQQPVPQPIAVPQQVPVVQPQVQYAAPPVQQMPQQNYQQVPAQQPVPSAQQQQQQQPAVQPQQAPALLGSSQQQQQMSQSRSQQRP